MINNIPRALKDVSKQLQYHILAGDREITEYERLLYKEFAKNNPDNYLCQHYLVLDNNRYRSPISYVSQSIYGVYEGTRLKSAIAINFNTQESMQFEDVGFNLKKDLINCNYCEALNFFIDHHKRHHSFEILRNLRIFMSNDLQNKNISFVLSTCSQNVIHLYERFGWTVVKKKIINHRIKYLIKLEILPYIDLQQLSTLVS